MAHRNQSGAGARIVRRSVGTASLLKGGYACITGWVLPLIGQHYIGRRDPAHSVTPRQQRYLAVRGASTMPDRSTVWVPILMPLYRTENRRLAVAVGKTNAVAA